MDIAETMVRDHNTSALLAGRSRLSDDDEREFRANVRGLRGGGSLVPLLERADVENIHILGHDKVVLSLADGRRVPGPQLAGSEAELVMMIRHLAATSGHTSRRFDTAAPILDLRLSSGHRLFAITAVAERTSVVIRRHRTLQSSLENLQESGTVTPQMAAVLRAAVRPPQPANMLVVGGTSAGKTTLLRSLLAEVPQSELIVTIEDTLELHLRSSGLHERTLALETRTSNTEGLGEISMYDLCKAALRMSPDRVIVGEVRGGEVMQLLQAMGIGNDGSLGTIHAGSTRAAVNKMLIYAQRSPDSPTPDSVLREISEVLHLLVYIKKLPDGRRAITSIREVTGYEEGRVATSEVFAPGPDGAGVYVRAFKAGGEPLARLVAAGFDPAVLGEPYRPAPAAPRAGPQQYRQPPGAPGGHRPAAPGPAAAAPGQPQRAAAPPPSRQSQPRPAAPAPGQPQRAAAPPASRQSQPRPAAPAPGQPQRAAAPPPSRQSQPRPAAPAPGQPQRAAAPPPSRQSQPRPAAPAPGQPQRAAAPPPSRQSQPRPAAPAPGQPQRAAAPPPSRQSQPRPAAAAPGQPQRAAAPPASGQSQPRPAAPGPAAAAG